MIVESIDSRNDLYSVSDIIDDRLIQDIPEEDFLSYDFENFENHEDRPRRLIKLHKQSVLAKINIDLFTKLPTISKMVGIQFKTIKTVYWLDLPGYKLEPHLDDDRVNCAMQIYLWGDDVGTTFYEDESLKVRKAFNFVPNTGYIMKQNADQLHGVDSTVTKPRLSCYSWLD